MGMSITFLLISIWCLLCFGVSRAIDCELNEGDPRTITVDQSGAGDFSKVQDAIDSIPNENTKWIRILVRPGTYREKVKIDKHKPCIMLIGSGRETTSIEFDSNHHPTNDTSTFTTEAENFVAKQISFKNTYNLEGPPKEMTQAVAVAIKGDKSSFYGCGFHGLQDTLWDAKGRHYFAGCVIEGAVDFIWGSGQSIYTNTDIVINGAGLGKGIQGFITAQGKTTEEERSGFVFIGGLVRGDGLVYLGRAYRAYSTVVFFRTTFSEVIYPEGWHGWNHMDHVNTLTYAEYECKGNGADKSGRVPWEKKLSPDEAQRFTDIAYIDQPEGWVNKQPSQ